MGLTKQYLRYDAQSVFGLVAGKKSNIILLNLHSSLGKYCVVGACEDTLIWDLRTGEKHLTLHGDKHDVTRIEECAGKQVLAVGYEDGMIRIFDLLTEEAALQLKGHKSSVTTLQYNDTGTLLVSGAKDTVVIVWDIMNECGLFRLNGHSGPITNACFIRDSKVIVTSSKDTFVKFWDFDTQHCFKTLVGHRSEVCDFVIVRNGHRLITGSTDGELRTWDIKYTSDEEILECEKIGSVFRQEHGRVVSLTTDRSEKFLICQGVGKVIELFKLLSDEEMRKHLAKRRKKLKKKQKDEIDEPIQTEVKLNLQDEVKKHSQITMTTKLASSDLIITDRECTIVSIGVDNSIQYCYLPPDVKLEDTPTVHSLGILGHRSDARSLAFSSDNTAVLSGSGDSLKLWNRSSLQCIRTIASEYVVCCLFAPGDRHIITGTKSGKLNIFDVASGNLLESVDAHTGSLWSIDMAADKRGIISGGVDRNVKFWKFELVSEGEMATSKQLTIEHTRTLKMDEEVLALKYSPDQRLLAVSLLDNTVKVFFADTLKFFLSLYGHKLPVLCLDISTDSTLLVSGSADRNVKIWGLDFGDCHKSMFAHNDSIMSVQFVPKTHLFFTGGKDGLIKQWDADNFEHIQTLEGHHAEIWSLAMSPSGNFLASASHDHSLRLWEKTQEPLILEEEREKQREKEMDETFSPETEGVAEKLMEAIQLYRDEKKEEGSKSEQSTASLHPLLRAMNVENVEKYVLEVLKRIKSNDLEKALLVLPFSFVTDFLKILALFIDNGWQLERSFRCLLFLLQAHSGAIIASPDLLLVIDQLQRNAPGKVDHIRDRIGFNVAGLKFLQNQLQEKEEITLFMDATKTHTQRKRKRKAIVSMRV